MRLYSTETGSQVSCRTVLPACRSASPHLLDQLCCQLIVGHIPMLLLQGMIACEQKQPAGQGVCELCAMVLLPSNTQ
jgi:hypothetical protein